MSKRNKQNATTQRVNAYSYYKANSSSQKSSTFSSKRSLTKIARAVAPHFSVFRLTVVIFGIFTLGYLLSVEPAPIIRFASSGVSARDTSIYKQGVQKIMTESVLNRTKLTFDYQSVEKKFIKQFPEIKSINISFDLIGRKPVIQMNLHKPAFIFSSGLTDWVINDKGVAIGRQIDLKDSFSAELLTIKDETGVTSKLGDTLVSPFQVSFLTSLVELLSKQQVFVETVFIPSVPKQIDILLFDENWRYKLNYEGSAVLQAGTILAVRQTLAVNNSFPEEYVDLRVPEKVYWK